VVEPLPHIPSPPPAAPLPPSPWQIDDLRERYAVLEGRAQASKHEAHEQKLRADAADARAARLEASVSELQDELARATDEARAAPPSRPPSVSCAPCRFSPRAAPQARAATLEATKADSREKLARQSHLIEKEQLSRRVAEAEERLKAAPAQFADALDELRRACRSSTTKLVERALPRALAHLVAPREHACRGGRRFYAGRRRALLLTGRDGRCSAGTEAMLQREVALRVVAEERLKLQCGAVK